MISGIDLSGFRPITGRPKGTKIARKAIREKEYRKLMDSLNIVNHLQPRTVMRHKRSFALLYYLGMRVGELLILRVRDLRQAVMEGETSLEGSLTKTGKPRLLQFSIHAQREIYELFEAMIESKKIKDNYFVFSSNNPFKALNKANFTLHMNEFIHDILGENYSTHSFRQGLITDMLVTHKMPLVVAQTYIGHSSMITTARYAKATEADTQRAINVVR